MKPYKALGDGRDAFGEPRVPRTQVEIWADMDAQQVNSQGQLEADGASVNNTHNTDPTTSLPAMEVGSAALTLPQTEHIQE